MLFCSCLRFVLLVVLRAVLRFVLRVGLRKPVKQLWF